MADLGRWMREDYRVAGEDMDADPEFRDGNNPGAPSPAAPKP